MQFSALAAAGGMGFVVTVLVILLEMRSRRLGSSSDLTDQLGMHVVATLPYFKGNKRSLHVAAATEGGHR